MAESSNALSSILQRLMQQGYIPFQQQQQPAIPMPPSPGGGSYTPAMPAAAAAPAWTGNTPAQSHTWNPVPTDQPQVTPNDLPMTPAGRPTIMQNPADSGDSVNPTTPPASSQSSGDQGGTQGGTPDKPIASSTGTDVTPFTAPDRDAAKKAVVQALQEAPPQRTQFHPSIGRRIAGALLGGLAGMGNPALGVRLGQSIYEGGPKGYAQAQSDYENKMSRLESIYGVEENAATEQAKESLQDWQKREAYARIKAEEARAEAEKARAENLRDKVGALNWAHLTLDDGTKVDAHVGPGDHYIGPDGERIPGGRIRQATPFKPETAKDIVVNKPSEVLRPDGTIEKIGTDLPKTPEKLTTEKQFVLARAKKLYGPNATTDDLTDEQDLQARHDWAAQTAKAQAEFGQKTVEGAPPKQLVINKQGQVREIGAGSTIKPDEMTLSGDNQIRVQAAKQNLIEIKDEATAQQAYQMAQSLAADNSGTSDYAFMLQFISATKPEGLAKFRLTNNELDFARKTRSLFGDIDAFALSLLTGQKLIGSQKAQMLQTMKIVAAAKLKAAQSGPGNVSAPGETVHPGGVSQSEIDAEVKRIQDARKKQNAPK